MINTLLLRFAGGTRYLLPISGERFYFSFCSPVNDFIKLCAETWCVCDFDSSRGRISPMSKVQAASRFARRVRYIKHYLHTQRHTDR